MMLRYLIVFMSVLFICPVFGANEGPLLTFTVHLTWMQSRPLGDMCSYHGRNTERTITVPIHCMKSSCGGDAVMEYTEYENNLTVRIYFTFYLDDSKQYIEAGHVYSYITHQGSKMRLGAGWMDFTAQKMGSHVKHPMFHFATHIRKNETECGDDLAVTLMPNSVKLYIQSK